MNDDRRANEILIKQILDEIKEQRNDTKDIKDDIGDINITLVKQHDSLDHHIKRTDLLTDHVDEMNKSLVATNNKVKRIEYIWLGASIVIGGVIGILAFLIKLA